MEGEAGYFIHVVIQCSYHRVILHILLRRLIHHHLTQTLRHTETVNISSWMKTLQCTLKSGLPHLNRHSALGQHAFSIQDLDGSISRASGNQLAIAAV